MLTVLIGEMETVLFHEEANSESKYLNKSRLGETGVLAYSKPLTPHSSCYPGSMSIRTELVARPHHGLPCPLRTLPPPTSAPQSTLWLRAVLAAVDMEGEELAWGGPAAPLAYTRLYQKMTKYQKHTKATKYLKQFFLSKLPACCFFLQTCPSAPSQAMDVRWHLRHSEKSICVFTSHGKWELPRNTHQDPLLFFPFCTYYFWETSPMQIWFKVRVMENKVLEASEQIFFIPEGINLLH